MQSEFLVLLRQGASLAVQLVSIRDYPDSESERKKAAGTSRRRDPTRGLTSRRVEFPNHDGGALGHWKHPSDVTRARVSSTALTT